MDRLIDADAFRRYAHEQLEGNKTYSIDEILEMIDEQPTAYDISKVVEELEEMKEKSLSSYDYETMKIAIEIVKRGGVE